jgi:hypothetical protein
MFLFYWRLALITRQNFPEAEFSRFDKPAR